YSVFCILILFGCVVNAWCSRIAGDPAGSEGSEMFAIRSAAIAAVFSMLAVVARAEGIVHKLAVQVDENDPAVMNLAFNNARNVRSYYETKGEKVQIEIVAYEPGLNML